MGLGKQSVLLLFLKVRTLFYVYNVIYGSEVTPYWMNVYPKTDRSLHKKAKMHLILESCGSIGNYYNKIIIAPQAHFQFGAGFGRRGSKVCPLTMCVLFT